MIIPRISIVSRWPDRPSIWSSLPVLLRSMSAPVLGTSTTSLKRSPTTIRVDKPSPVLPGNTNLRDFKPIGVSESAADTPKNRSQSDHGGSSGKLNNAVIERQIASMLDFVICSTFVTFCALLMCMRAQYLVTLTDMSSQATRLHNSWPTRVSIALSNHVSPPRLK